MTTWCRPDRASSALNLRSSCLSSAGSVAALHHPSSIANNSKRNHHRHHVRYSSARRPSDSSECCSDRHQTAAAASRHSIADILGWKNCPADSAATNGVCKIEREQRDGHPFEPFVLSERHRYDEDDASEEEEEEEDGMASDCVDVADMMNISDEPLDLSLDKSKCRQRERERESGTPIKRAKGMVVDAMEPASDAGTDEGDMDGVGQWGNVQPHLQMAANFSTVLQYYLTAARLWQTSEVMRCQESQQRAGGETDSEANDDGHASDTNTAAAAAVVAAAVAAAGTDPSGIVFPVQSQQQQPPQSNNSGGGGNKRRKNKDGHHHQNMVMVADLVNSGGAESANGQSRPRKTRTTFTGKQLFELERIFEQKKYLSSNERQEVARLLNVTGSQIKIWFQNRRTKWKKQDPNTAAELAQLKSASRSSQQGTSTSSSVAAAPKGKNGDDQPGSANANDDIASAGDNDEINSDDASSPPAPRSPSSVCVHVLLCTLISLCFRFVHQLSSLLFICSREEEKQNKMVE